MARTLKVFAWGHYQGDSYFVACGSKAEAARLEGCGDPRQLFNLREADPAYEEVARLAAGRPGRVLRERPNGGRPIDGTTISDGPTPIARRVHVEDPDAPLTLRYRYTLEMIETEGREPAPASTSCPRPPTRHFRLAGDLEARLRAESRRTGAPASEVVRRALDSYLP